MAIFQQLHFDSDSSVQHFSSRSLLHLPFSPRIFHTHLGRFAAFNFTIPCALSHERRDEGATISLYTRKKTECSSAAARRFTVVILRVLCFGFGYTVGIYAIITRAAGLPETAYTGKLRWRGGLIHLYHLWQAQASKHCFIVTVRRDEYGGRRS